MTIQNGLGITGYSRRLTRAAREGQPAYAKPPIALPMIVALLAQISTITIGTYADDGDTFTSQITKPDGTVVSTATTRASSVPVDAAAAATAHAAAINATTSLRGHVVASAASNVVTLRFVHPNVAYPVATAAVTGTTATAATTQTAGGTDIPLGRFVKSATSAAGQSAVAALESTDAETAIAGVIMAPLTQYPNGESALSSAVDVCPVGQMAAVAYDGPILMRNNGSVATVPGGTVYAVIANTGGDEVGEARSDGDGVAQVDTFTPTAANTTHYALRIRFRGVDYFGTMISDGSGTATEICDGLRTDLGTIAGLTFSGTATLIITGPEGETFTAESIGVGVLTRAATTAAVPYAIPISTDRAHWLEVTAPGELGPVNLRTL